MPSEAQVDGMVTLISPVLREVAVPYGSYALCLNSVRWSLSKPILPPLDSSTRKVTAEMLF